MRLVMAALLVVGANAARAEGPTAVVAVGSCSDAALGTSARGLRDALARRAGSAVSDEDATARSLGGISKGSLDDADRLISGARIDFNKGALDRAQKAVLAAREELFALPPSEGRWKSLRDSAALLAWIASKDGQPAAADEALGQVLRVDPSFVPDARLYPPAIQKLARAQAQKLKAEPTGTLAVTTRPGPLSIFIDGRPVGKAPLSMRLPRGEYRVEADFGGRRGLPHAVKLDEAASVELDQAFDGAIVADAGPCFEAPASREERLRGLSNLAHLLGARTLVAVRTDEPAPKERYLVATALDVDTGQEAREAKVKLSPSGPAPGALDKLADFLTTGDVAPPLEATKGARKPELARADVGSAPGSSAAATNAITQPAPAPSNGLRTGAYVSGGLAVVGLATAGYFALDLGKANSAVRDAQGPDGTFRPGSEQAVSDALSRQSRDQKLALVGAGVGVAAGATAAVLYLMSAPSAAPSTATTGAHLAPSGLAFDF